MNKRNIIITIFTIMILSGIAMFSPSVLTAQDTSPKEKNWEFNLAPFYLWAVSIDGDLTAMGNAQSLQADFDELAKAGAPLSALGLRVLWEMLFNHIITDALPTPQLPCMNRFYLQVYQSLLISIGN